MTSYSSLRELNQAPGEDRDHRHPAAVAPELLVGYGFRGWIAGYQTGDVQFWERVWRLYSNILRPPAATGAVDYLASWAKSVNASSRRSVEISPLEACEFCRDEC